MLSTAVNFQFERQSVAFIERYHAGTFNCRNVNECIGLPIVALNKAEAFHRIEKLNSAAGLFTSERALWCTTAATATAISTACRAAARCGITISRRCTISNRERLTFDLQFGCRDPPTAIDERKAQRLTFGQPDKPCLFNR